MIKLPEFRKLNARNYELSSESTSEIGHYKYLIQFFLAFLAP